MLGGFSGLSDRHRNVSQTSIALAGRATRCTITAQIMVAGSRKSTKSYRRIAQCPFPQHIRRRGIFFLLAVASLPTTTQTDRVYEGGKRCSALQFVGVVLFRSPKEKEEKTRGKDREHFMSTTRYFTRHAGVRTPGYLTTAPSIEVLLAARRAAPQGGCGCENVECKLDVSVCTSQQRMLWMTMLGGHRAEKVTAVPRLPEELWLCTSGFLKHNLTLQLYEGLV